MGALLHYYMEMSNRKESSSTIKSAMIIVLSEYRNNVLLDGSFNAKLGDFGLAREMPLQFVDGYSMVTALHNMRSLGYGAPEMNSYRHSPKTDVYAYGIVSH